MKKCKMIVVWLLMTCCLLACKENKSQIEEEGIKYEATNDIFPNPERGFMKMFSVQSEGTPINSIQLEGLRGDAMTLVQRVYYFNLFKDKPLSQAQLDLIQADMDVVRTAGLKIVIRFAYTDQMDGTDAPLVIVEQHIDQLKPLFEANDDVIAFVQAGFIGPWGEWHNSSNGLDTEENQRKVLEKLLAVLPQHIMVQVRTPDQKQKVFNTTLPVSKDIAYTAEGRARVGHHNDCFMTGGTNYGTYINITEDKQYISNEAMYVPVGGETCPPEESYSPNCTNARTELKLLKWTYLNLDYYQPTLDLWRSSGCFDEFRRNLGYRLALTNAVVPEEASGSFRLTLKINNSGYAPLYIKKKVSLVFKSKSEGTYIEKELAFDIRDCKPSATETLEENVSLSGISPGEYSLYLRISDSSERLTDKIEYAVRLANSGVWTEENGGMNSLKANINIL